MPGEEEVMGKEVKENNEAIVHCLLELRKQRDDLEYLLEKQLEEKKTLEMEMERLTYKLCLINKSMGQRAKALENYNETIGEIEQQYEKLKQNALELKTALASECDQLDSLINKKTSTEDALGKDDVDEASSSTQAPPAISSSHGSTLHPHWEDSPSTMSGDVGQNHPIHPTNTECVCLPNKDGRCVREKKASKMIQASPPAEPELPTKLEKDQIGLRSEEKSDQVRVKEDDPVKPGHIILKRSAEKGAQTADVKLSPEDADAMKAKRDQLSQAIQQHKESHRRSL
ncbi:hypothetical protein NQ315_013514 [Exocentrus adspersus]|uniref:Uncharacterized protein n=1 Tax=Exocentrus adspersus TaxID=1586481 RepID=A0AAV8V6S1_9CUCU|nr:hypothetical protein NQ315_013514 [Exocentrus adspersus]